MNVTLKKDFIYWIVIVLLIGVVVWDSLHSGNSLKRVQGELEYALERVNIANRAIKFLTEQSEKDKGNRELLRGTIEQLTKENNNLGSKLNELYKKIRDVSDREREDIQRIIRAAETIKRRVIQCIADYKKIEDMAMD